MDYSLVNVNLKTGRTHQIRVHFSHIRHPIISDTLYGNPSHLINRQALHCKQIEFIHPITNKNICITSPIPKEFYIN